MGRVAKLFGGAWLWLVLGRPRACLVNPRTALGRLSWPEMLSYSESTDLSYEPESPKWRAIDTLVEHLGHEPGGAANPSRAASRLA